MIKNILTGIFDLIRPALFFGGIFTAAMMGSLAAPHTFSDPAAPQSPAHQAGASSLASPAADGDLLITGWGIGSCEDDEWNYGYGCLHGDAMPADDPRLTMIKSIEVINQG